MDPETNRISKRISIAAFAIFAVTGLVHAFVHDGKSYAIEAALPQLELKDNPFVLREAWWNGKLGIKETKILQHQLFKRNEYWFWLGCSLDDAEGSIHIYDSEGNLADAEAWEKNNVAAVRVVPKSTGTHYIRVAVDKASQMPVEWAVIYAYR